MYKNLCLSNSVGNNTLGDVLLKLSLLRLKVCVHATRKARLKGRNFLLRSTDDNNVHMFL
jgi:hypothetical protein